MENISDYEILEKVAETPAALVFRARRPDVPETRIIKLLKAETATPSEIAGFKQEYELIKQIDSENVVRVYDIFRHQDDFALVMEDFGGVSLKRFLDTNQLDIRTFLHIGISVAGALDAVHGRGIVHKDIKPGNILINIDSSAVKITDFGVSSMLTHLQDAIYHPDVISGTLPYMSPEQTGRTNRGIDYRTDLYSLGAALYEALAGRVPFQSNDPLELIHAHLAAVPKPPAEYGENIPQILSDIIMKLLSKNAEERYQTARSVMKDLQKCLKSFDSTGRIEPFKPAVNDIADRFNIPQKLYGREDEFSRLTAEFQSVCEGRPKIMFVSGRPGIGKSAIVYELQKPVAAKRGWFISGKYEKLRRDVPYLGLIQAFQGLVRRLLSESGEKIREWRTTLQDALDPNGGIITEMIPEVELIIGKQAPAAELGPEEIRNRFNIVFRNFISVFARKEHPLTIFLDDIQWADHATLELIKNLIADTDIGFLFIVAAYRDSEMFEAHPVSEIKKELETMDVRCGEIRIGPMKPVDIKALLLDFLKCAEDRAEALAEIVHEKTGGNPFFVIQFLHTLYNEKVLTFRPETGWRWDNENLRRMQVTDNVVELMAGKIGRLDPRVQDVLKMCACIGNRFDLETLASIMDSSLEEALAGLTDAVNEGYLSVHKNLYAFRHDRIREAAYSMIPDDEKAAVHYKIGKRMLNTADENEVSKKLFSIVDHLNSGYRMIADSGEKDTLAAMNLEAGRKARASAAYSPALKYFTYAMACLRPDCWESQYRQAFDIYREAVEAAYLNGNYELMEQWAGEALTNVKETTEAVKFHEIRILADIARIDPAEAIDKAVRAVKQLGLSIPKNPSKIRLMANLLKLKSAFGNRPLEDLLELPKMEDQRMLAVFNVLTRIAGAAHTVDPNLYAYIILLRMRLILKYGAPFLAPAAYIGYAIIQAAVLKNYESGSRISKIASEMCDKLDSRTTKAIVEIRGVFVQHWTEHLRNTFETLYAGYRSGLDYGNLEYGGYCLFMHGVHRFAAGESLPAVKTDMEGYFRVIKRMNQRNVLHIQRIFLQLCMNLTGDPESPAELNGEMCNDAEILPVLTRADDRRGIVFLYWSKLYLGFMFGRYDSALESCRKAIPLLGSITGMIFLPLFAFYESLCILETMGNRPANERRRLSKRVRRRMKQLQRWAFYAPMNYLHKYELIQALYAAAHGRSDEAEACFEKAAAHAGENGYVNEEALANELAARYYLSRSLKRIARLYMAAAHKGYAVWGAVSKVKRLEEEYSELLMGTGHKRSELISTYTTSQNRSEMLDLSTVLKASQAITEEINLHKLLIKLIRFSVENAGAQRGMMILDDEGRLTVEVEAGVETDAPVLKSTPVDEHPGVSVSVVNYAARTGETVILDNACEEGDFKGDAYIAEGKIRSILCVPIIHQTKLTGVLYLENNLNAGAFVHERSGILSALSAQAAISIDNARLYENLEDKVRERTAELRRTRDALWGEMQLAKKIQTALVPKHPVIPGYSIAAHMEPADDVGGDYYDVIRFDGRTWLIIGDVSGHGVPSGLVMMMVQTAIKTVLGANPKAAPSALLTAVNRTITENIRQLDESKHMTITVMTAHDAGRFTYSGAHEDILIFRADSGIVDVIETTGVWIGLEDDIQEKLEDRDIYLNTGDVLILYTDGITESWRADDPEDLFGDDRLRRVIAASGAQPVHEIRNELLNALKNYDSDDDITFMIVKRDSRDQTVLQTPSAQELRPA